MRRTIVLLLVLAVALALPLAGCGDEDDGPPMEVTVRMADTSYQPSSIEVAAGGTVTWTNEDGVDHTVTGADFDSGRIEPGARFSQTFAEPGTYDIQCAIHPQMQGVVTVVE